MKLGLGVEKDVAFIAGDLGRAGLLETDQKCLYGRDNKGARLRPERMRGQG